MSWWRPKRESWCGTCGKTFYGQITANEFMKHECKQVLVTAPPETEPIDWSKYKCAQLGEIRMTKVQEYIEMKKKMEFKFKEGGGAFINETGNCIVPAYISSAIIAPEEVPAFIEWLKEIFL